MLELRHALNSADPLSLRDLARWFRRQASTCETLADYADAVARVEAGRMAWVKLCRSGRLAEARAAGAPTAMLAAWETQHRTTARRARLQHRKEQVIDLAAAKLPQRAIAAQLGISVGRVNQILNSAKIVRALVER